MKRKRNANNKLNKLCSKKLKSNEKVEKTPWLSRTSKQIYKGEKGGFFVFRSDGRRDYKQTEPYYTRNGNPLSFPNMYIIEGIKEKFLKNLKF